MPRQRGHGVPPRATAMVAALATALVAAIPAPPPARAQPRADYMAQLDGSHDVAWAVAADAAGATYVAGYTDSWGFPTLDAFQPAYGGGEYDAFVLKLDAADRLVYATYLGGRDEDRAYGLAVDASGAAYVTGYTHSPDFPVRAAGQPHVAGDKDAFVVKLSPDGRMAWGTFLGGVARDQGRAVAIAPGGDVVVAGSSDSPDFPAPAPPVPGKRRDAFVARLSAEDGAPRWSTLLGGSGDELAFGVAVGPDGAPTVAGYTTSQDLPVAAAAQERAGGGEDAFVLRLAPDGRSLEWATYLGGAGAERASSVAVDPTGAAYVTGYTESDDFPVDAEAAARLLGDGRGIPSRRGGRDVFVAKVARDGGWSWRTVVDGEATDHSFGIAVDQAGASAIAGYTRSTNFPWAPAAVDPDPNDGDAFVLRLDPLGRPRSGGGRLAGSADDRLYALAIGPGGSLHAAGYSYSRDLDLVGADRPSHRGDRDVVVGVLGDGPTPESGPGAGLWQGAADRPASQWRFTTLVGGRGNGPGAVARADIDAGRAGAAELERQGAVLFHAPWRSIARAASRDGPAVRPGGLSLAPTAERAAPPLDRFYRRSGGPESQACVGCHNQLIDRSGLVRLVAGGAGDGAANVVVPGDTPRDAVERNPRPVFGSAVKARVAAEMTAALAGLARHARAVAAAAGRPAIVVLAVKGVSFGVLVARPDGTLDTRGVVGVDADLVVRPFGVKGTAADLDDVVAHAAAAHLGLAIDPAGPVERPRAGDAARLSEGDTLALVRWIAARPAPRWWAPEGDRSQAVVGRGQAAFAALGCAACHVPSLPLDVAASGQAAESDPDGGAVALFSDLRRHPMGADLADPRPEGGVPADVFLTAPLWGVGSTGPWLHDGRAATLEEAVLWHGGAARAARARFAALAPGDRAALVAFLDHLVVEPDDAAGSEMADAAAQPLRR